MPGQRGPHGSASSSEVTAGEPEQVLTDLRFLVTGTVAVEPLSR